MTKYINRVICVIITILLILICFINLTKEKEYIKNINENILVKIYTNQNGTKILKDLKRETDSDVIAEKLKNQKVPKFIINNKGNITAGKHYNNGKYVVSIIRDDNVIDFVYLENETLYLKENGVYFVSTIAKTFKEAKEIAKTILKEKKIDEKYKIYFMEKDKKNISQAFKNRIKNGG